MQHDGEADHGGLTLTGSRLRLRRIKDQALKRRFGLEMGKARDFFFDAGHFERVMRRGRWDTARYYLNRFLPDSGAPSGPARRLVMHLVSAHTVAEVVAGGPSGAFSASLLDDAPPELALCRDVLHQMHADPRRASKVWKKVVPYAVNLALYMAAKCPELKDKLQLLHNTGLPWEAAPIIGVRGPRRKRRKAVDRPSADVLTRAYLQQKRSLSVQETNTSSDVASEAPGPLPLFTKLEQIIQETTIPGDQPMENADAGSSIETSHSTLKQLRC
ncbi:hypothetical protein ACP4OV_023035 [Aristida adscensionis]